MRGDTNVTHDLGVDQGEVTTRKAGQERLGAGGSHRAQEGLSGNK